MNSKKKGLNTICTHIGELEDTQHKGAISPLYMSTSYAYEDVDVKRYPRYFNTPNQEGLCKKVAALEHAESALIFGFFKRWRSCSLTTDLIWWNI